MSAKSIQLEEIKALQAADDILVRNPFVYAAPQSNEDIQGNDIPAWINVTNLTNAQQPAEIIVPAGTVITEAYPGEGPVFIVNILADYPGTGLHPKTWYGKPIFSGGGIEEGTILSVLYTEFCKYRENRSGDGGTLTYIEYFFDNVELDGSVYKTTQDYLIILST